MVLVGGFISTSVAKSKNQYVEDVWSYPRSVSRFRLLHAQYDNRLFQKRLLKAVCLRCLSVFPSEKPKSKPSQTDPLCFGFLVIYIINSRLPNQKINKSVYLLSVVTKIPI